MPTQYFGQKYILHNNAIISVYRELGHFSPTVGEVPFEGKCKLGRFSLGTLSCRIFWAQFLFVKNIANCLTQIPRFYWLNKVRATAGCELLRVRAARVVTLKNRVRVAAVVRDAAVVRVARVF